MSHEQEFVVRPIHAMCLAINEVREGDKRLGNALHLMSILIAEMYHRLNDPQETPHKPLPAPRTPRLVEAVEALVAAWHNPKIMNITQQVKDVEQALAAEKERSELVKKATTLCYIYRGSLPSHAREAVEALDAFDKEAQ